MEIFQFVDPFLFYLQLCRIYIFILAEGLRLGVPDNSVTAALNADVHSIKWMVSMYSLMFN